MKRTILLLSLSLHIFSQAQDRKVGIWNVSLMAEAITINPAKPITDALHPGILLGYNFKTKSADFHNHIVDVNFGYYYHELMGNTLLLWPEYRFERLFFKKKFSVELMCGLGYKHNIADRTVYKYKGGKFKKITDFGSSQAFVDLGYGFGFQIKHNFKVFTNQRFLVAAPFSLLVPVGFHWLSNLGVQYQF